MLNTADLERALATFLRKFGPKTHYQDIYQYAVLPAGKLFRPKLVLSIGEDLKVAQKNDLLHLACSLETHHAYTLVHDDLPDLDNDEMRRGKATVHKQFGSWRAILVGDGLLNLSIHLLSKINSPQLAPLLQFYTWATGPKGLILGQTMDMNKEGNHSWERLLRIHELKTGRLFQVAFVGVGLLSSQKENHHFLRDMLRLGAHLGISFQLIDDLLDLVEQKENLHEQEINPFLCYKEGPAQLEKSLKILHHIFAKYELHQTKQETLSYLQQAALKMGKNRSELISIVGDEAFNELESLMLG